MTALPDWDALAAGRSSSLVSLLRSRYEAGSFATTAIDLANDASSSSYQCSPNEAAALLDSCGPWLDRLEEQQPAVEDPETGIWSEPATTIRYEYRGGVTRRIPWMLFVHGMGTKGEWQQHLAFDMAAWQGTAPPSFIVKYGIIGPGAFFGFRRRQLAANLVEELTTVAKRADRYNAGAVPDVVAHSLGTWLLGHVLLDQLDRPDAERIRVGRVILTGCILRPDFPWAELQSEGIVADVLNHYGTADKVVPLAHMTVGDSGPSGRRGFDIGPPSGPLRVLNVAAHDYEHSDVLDPTKDAYDRFMDVWRPFLTNPVGHAGRGIEITNPTKRWRALPWPFRRGRHANH